MGLVCGFPIKAAAEPVLVAQASPTKRCCGCRSSPPAQLALLSSAPLADTGATPASLSAGALAGAPQAKQ